MNYKYGDKVTVGETHKGIILPLAKTQDNEWWVMTDLVIEGIKIHTTTCSDGELTPGWKEEKVQEIIVSYPEDCPLRHMVENWQRDEVPSCYYSGQAGDCPKCREFPTDCPLFRGNVTVTWRVKC